MAVRRRVIPRVPWHAVGAAVAVVAVTLATISGGLHLTGGRLIYPIDDPYIHMSIARNLALHGSWGVNPGAFEPASSSPLWTVLLAAVDRLTGVRDATPLGVNLLLAVVVVLVLDQCLRSFIAHGLARGATVLAIALAIPLPAVISTGMEAPLHVLLTLRLAWMVAAADPHDTRGPTGPTNWWLPGLLSGLSVLTRFESLFLVAPLAVAALGRGRRRLAASLVIGAAIALASYVAFALPRGGLWLPNPVLVKSPLTQPWTPHGFGLFLLRIPDQLIGHRFSHMTALLLAAAWLLLIRPRTAGDRAATARTLLAVFIAATLLHVQFANLGWFFRYEAYLVALGVSALAALLACGAPFDIDRLGARPLPAPARAFAVILLLVLAIPLATRSVRSLRAIAPAMQNIYEQQFQMARFVQSHFRDRSVAVNDLGAVGYYGGARLEDLMGLASSDIARARIAGRFDGEAIRSHCAGRGVEVALVYRSWFSGASALPSDWSTVARWTVPDEVTVGDTTVTILATGADETSRAYARAAVRAFAPQMPPRVRVELLE